MDPITRKLVETVKKITEDNNNLPEQPMDRAVYDYKDKKYIQKLKNEAELRTAITKAKQGVVDGTNTGRGSIANLDLNMAILKNNAQSPGQLRQPTKMDGYGVGQTSHSPEDATPEEEIKDFRIGKQLSDTVNDIWNQYP
jgi:hypothetical protein